MSSTRIFKSFATAVALLIICCTTNIHALLSPLAKPTSVFSSSADKVQTVESLKSQILQLGAALDRGQAYNPTSGSYYSDRMEVARLVLRSCYISLFHQCQNILKYFFYSYLLYEMLL